MGLVIFFKTLYLLTPLALIWGANHLLGTSIEYTFTNWLAIFVLVIGLRFLLSLKVEVTRV
jgi:hypothetical protein